VAYITLLALFLTVTNLVPLSAIGFVPILLCGWRFFGRSYPSFMTPLVAFAAFAALSTILYDPASLTEFDFYRRDGNFFISYAPILAGCLYMHRWDLNKVLRWFYIFAVAINVPLYLYYLAQTGLLAILTHPGDSFGSFFIARNAAGGFLAMLFCLGVASYLQQRSRMMLMLIGLNGLMLFSTYSRGSLLGVVAMLPYLFLGRKNWVLVTMVTGIIAASLTIAMLHTHASTDYMGYSFAISNPDEKVANLDIRYEWLWPRALAYFREIPLLGLGFGSFDDQIGSVVNYFGVFGQAIDVSVVHSDSHAHNSYLNILAEMGVAGLALMLAFYWKLIQWCREGAIEASNDMGRNFTAYRFIELSAVCLLAMAFSEHRLTAPSNVLVMTLVISLLLASRASQRYPSPVRPAPAPRGGLSTAHVRGKTRI
jgi:O-antigen ligase